MAWIESHQNLLDHPKTKSLKNLMGWDMDQTIGKLHRFWWWCAHYAKDGQLTKFNDSQLAEAVGLNPEAGKQFVDSMVSAGFIDREPAFRVHDWLEYFGLFLRRSQPEKFNTVRKLYNNCTTTVQHQPNHTKPNHTKKEKVKKEKFAKPEPDEVTAYAKSIGYPLDGKKFCDYYESKGWLVGKTPMKSWQAAVRTWMSNNFSAIEPPKPSQAERDAKQRETWAKRGLCTVCGSKLSLAVDGKMRCDSCNCEASPIIKIKGI